MARKNLIGISDSPSPPKTGSVRPSVVRSRALRPPSAPMASSAASPDPFRTSPRRSNGRRNWSASLPRGTRSSNWTRS